MKSEDDIRAWLVSYIVKLAQIDAGRIRTDAPFDTFGIDSAALIGLAGDLEEWLGREFEPTIIYEYPTIDDISRHLSQAA